MTPLVPIMRELGRRDRGERHVVETPLARTVEAADGAGTEERTEPESFARCSNTCMLRACTTEIHLLSVSS